MANTTIKQIATSITKLDARDYLIVDHTSNGSTFQTGKYSISNLSVDIPVDTQAINGIIASYIQNNPIKANSVTESGRFCSNDGATHTTASENDSWYRIYSDGWIEMGGTKTSGQNIVFYKIMHPNYTFYITPLYNKSDIYVTSKQNGLLNLSGAASGSPSIEFLICGYMNTNQSDFILVNKSDEMLYKEFTVAAGGRYRIDMVSTAGTAIGYSAG